MFSRRDQAAELVVCLALFVLGGCAGLQVKDPAKAALFTVSHEWVALREYVIRASYATPPQVSDAQVTEFKELDRKFGIVYNLALSAYLAGSDNTAVFDQDIRKLRELLLEARRKFYPVTSRRRGMRILAGLERDPATERRAA